MKSLTFNGNIPDFVSTSHVFKYRLKSREPSITGLPVSQQFFRALITMVCRFPASARTSTMRCFLCPGQYTVSLQAC